MAESIIQLNHHCSNTQSTATNSFGDIGREHSNSKSINESRIGLSSITALTRLYTEIESVLHFYEQKCKNERLVLIAIE